MHAVSPRERSVMLLLYLFVWSERSLLAPLIVTVPIVKAGTSTPTNEAGRGR